MAKYITQSLFEVSALTLSANCLEHSQVNAGNKFDYLEYAAASDILIELESCLRVFGVDQRRDFANFHCTSSMSWAPFEVGATLCDLDSIV